MAEPVGKRAIVGDDLSLHDLTKLIAERSKKKTVPKPRARKVDPGYEVPPEFLLAQERLIQQLLMSDVATATEKSTGKGKNAGRDNILGVHIGQKFVKRKPTGSLCVIVTLRVTGFPHAERGDYGAAEPRYVCTAKAQNV